MFLAWLSLPLPVRTFVVLAVGVALGPLINWAIYRLAYAPRPFSPWGPKHARAEERTWRDRLPIAGWWFLRRERSLHGPRFWVRPLLIETLFPVALALLYHFASSGGYLPTALRTPADLQPFALWLHVLFAAHAILLVFLVVATFIDFDEQTIPDLVTLPGTLIGLLFAASTPHLLMPTRPISSLSFPEVSGVERLWFYGTGVFPERWMGSNGLLLGLLVVAIWAFALLDRRIILRRGYAMAVRYFFHAMFRHGTWLIVAGLWLGLSLAVLACYQFGSPAAWQGLLNALVGLAGGGLVVWSVRTVAWLALRKEAMGFGDVTFLAMIGVYLGWQATLIIFFLAPLVALGFALFQLLLKGGRELPFGPYLSVGTVLLVLLWDPIWNDRLRLLFTGGPIIPFMLLFLLAALGLMLRIWRIFEHLLFHRAA